MKKGDIIIIFVVLIISLSSIFFMLFSNAYADEKYAVIEVDGEKVKRISFNNETKSLYEFDFGQEVGTIEIKDGRVRMLEMVKKICPNKVCSLTGWIDKKYQAIVCLPNKITVSIEDIDKNQEGIDEVSF